jgi:hypothetical protein
MRIRIRMFLGLPDPHPDPLVKARIRLWIRILPSSSKNSKKNLDFFCFVLTSLLLVTSVADLHPDPDP